MFREGPGGFTGGLSAGKYMAITGAPSATATRDLGDLAEKGALVRTGERKAIRDHLPVPVRATPYITINKVGRFCRRIAPAFAKVCITASFYR